MQNFAMGMVYALPSGANPTPVPFAILKDATWDIKLDKKPLNGQWQAPIDVGQGKQAHTVKAKSMDIRASMLAAVVSGSILTGGSVTPVMGESTTIPTTPFQYTVANGANFAEDAGVLDVTAGKWLTRVASAPATGQYSVNVGTGQYTFAAADTGHVVAINYSYTTASVGQTNSFTNAVQGPSTPYLLRLYNVYKINGVLRPVGVKFPCFHFDNLSLGFKVEDWSEFDISGFAAQDPTSLKVYDSYVGE